jgi:two-component system response regulator AtoC
MKEKILIIEDDSGVRYFLEEALKGEGYASCAFESYEEAAREVSRDIDLVITDIKLPGIDGFAVLEEIKQKIDAPVLIITAYGTKKNALEAIRRGAADFFVKPIALDELKVMVKRTLVNRALRKEVRSSREVTTETDVLCGVVGKSPPMKAIFGNVKKIAGTDLNILVTGDTGVGKEEISKLIHLLSGRNGDMLVVNCASIPDTLLESELFGYEKGAFTGAFQHKSGKLESADGGTILLDEIGEMTPYIQAKLLRVIETKEIERLGDTRKRKIDMRVIATTNREIEREIKKGGFREDLFYRLAQFHISVPPLRERKEDMPALIDHFMAECSRMSGVLPTMEEKARGMLCDYAWPGNIRELKSVIKRAFVMCENRRITVDDLPLYMSHNKPIMAQFSTDRSLDDAISAFEKAMLVDALRKTEGSQSKAAKQLGISERSMWYRVKKYAIETDWKA